jgi:hypothetical protein
MVSCRDRDGVAAAHAFRFISGPKKPPISDAGVRRDDLRPGRIRFDLSPDLADEHAQDIYVSGVSRAPDVLQQPVVREQLPRMPT